MNYIFFYDTVIGKIGIVQNESAITHVYFDHEYSLEENLAGYTLQETPLLIEAANQLKEYFRGNRKTFQLPLAPAGTQFQQKVWKALQSIPYGNTASYKQIAEIVGSPNAYRAVGAANHVNPIAIFIPCHRVIGTNKKLVGYAGGLNIKEYLLNLEGIQVSGGRITWRNTQNN